MFPAPVRCWRHAPARYAIKFLKSDGSTKRIFFVTHELSAEAFPDRNHWPGCIGSASHVTTPRLQSGKSTASLSFLRCNSSLDRRNFSGMML